VKPDTTFEQAKRDGMSEASPVPQNGNNEASKKNKKKNKKKSSIMF
jgi:hypothetical protein